MVIDLKSVSDLVPGTFWVQARIEKQESKTGIEFAAGTKPSAITLQTSKAFKVVIGVQHSAFSYEIT